jgi:hypothetical protein
MYKKMVIVAKRVDGWVDAISHPKIGPNSAIN